MRSERHTGSSITETSNMATQSEGGGKDEIKTQFMTREGIYKLMTLSEYSRPNRVVFNGQGNTPVKVSFITLNDQTGTGDRICFNVGKELYFYVYKGVRKVSQSSCTSKQKHYINHFFAWTIHTTRILTILGMPNPAVILLPAYAYGSGGAN